MIRTRTISIPGLPPIKKSINHSVGYSFIQSLQYTGVSYLSRVITLNDKSVSPTFWYNGADAGASSWAAEYGSDLSIAGTGADPTLNYGSSFNDGTDGVQTTGKRYSGVDYDLTTQDFIDELVLMTPTAGTHYYYADIDANDGFGIYSSSSALSVAYRDGGSTVTNVVAISPANIYHVVIVADRSGNSRIYLNNAIGATNDISSIASLTRYGDTSINYAISSNGAIFQYARWDFGVGGLDSHAQDALVSERFHKLFGTYPQLARGTALPVSYTRASSATLYKYNTTTSAWEGWTMGAGAPRVCGLVGVSQTARGFHSEQQVDNICRYSNAFDSWSKSDAGDSVDTNNAAQPTSIKGNYFDGLICDSTSGAHLFYVACTANPTATTNAFSMEIKKGSADYCYLTLNSTSLGVQRAWFDLTTFVEGTKTASVTNSKIVSLGGSRYIIQMTVVAFAEVTTVYCGTSDADNSVTFSGGDGATVNLWVANAQMEAGPIRTSYIDVPSTSTVTRQADVLYYEGLANLGGVGSNKQGQVKCKFLMPNIDNDASKYVWEIDDGGSANDRLLLRVSSGEQSAFECQESGNPQFSIASGADDANGVEHTVICKYKTNHANMIIDGSIKTPDTSCTIPDELDRIYPGSLAGASQLNGLVSEFEIKPKDIG